MFHRKKQLIEDKESFRKRADALASDLAGEMLKTNDLSAICREQDEQIRQLRKEIAVRIKERDEALAERDRWHSLAKAKDVEILYHGYLEERKAADAGIETLDDLISVYHKAIEELYRLREKLTERARPDREYSS